jgi:outer membrane autotransporter protein
MAEISQQATDLLLGKAVNGGGGGAACATAAQMNPASLSPRGTSLAGQLASAAAGAICNAGGWVDADGGFLNQSGAAGYHAATAGFTAGIDHLFAGTDTRLGLAIGYDTTNLNDKAGGQASDGITRFSLYADQPAGPVNISGVLSYGLANDSTTRAAGLGTIGESRNAGIVSGGVAASTTINLGPYAVLPAAGIRFASVGAETFAESARGLQAAFAVSGAIPLYSSVQPYVSLGLNRSFVTDDGTSISPSLTIGYEVQAADRGLGARLRAADGTGFASAQSEQAAGDAILAAGLSAGRGNWSFFASYAAHVAANWTAQTAEAGLRIRF